MTTASSSILAALEAFETLQEYPFSAFDLSVKRIRPDCPASGDVETRYLLTTPDKYGMMTSIGLRVGPNNTINSLHAAMAVQMPADQGGGLTAFAVAYTPATAPYWSIDLNEVGTLNADGQWEPNGAANKVQYSAPAKSVAVAAAKAITNVGQRLITRLSRVDRL